MDSQEREIRYSYKHAPTLRAFADSNAFIRGLMGPFRSGKSSGCVIEIIQRALKQNASPDGIRHSRWIVVRNTYAQLNDTTIKTFHQWLPPHIFGDYVEQKHTYTIRQFERTNIEVLFRALDRPDHVANLLSLEVTGGWINEAREVPWAIVDALQGRVGQFPALRDGGPTWYGLFMDTNPPDADSKWFRFFEETQHNPKFARLFRQPSGLSPQAENLPNLPQGRGYYENLSQGKSTEWVKVYIHGEYGFVVEGKPIFPEYSDELHATPCDPIPRTDIYRGWDFGLTPSCVFTQIQPTGRFIVFDELISEEMGVDRFSDAVLEHCAQKYPGATFIDIGDPAGVERAQTDEKTCFQILQAKDIDIEPGLQDPTIRWESVRKPLRNIVGGRAQLQLHPRCRMLRKGFLGGYHFRRLHTSAERYSPKAEKNEVSHPHDALQYVCTRLFAADLTVSRRPQRYRDEDDDVVLYGEDGRSRITGY